MGTTWRVDLVVADESVLAALETRCADVLNRIVTEMSQWEHTSHLSRFNRLRGGQWLDLPRGFAAVVGEALEIAEMTRGAFDPTVGRASQMWGFGSEAVTRTPSEDAIADAAKAAGWQRLAFDRAMKRLRQPGGVALDLCAIAKGYGVDCLAAVLEGAGITSYLAEIGGELRAAGVKPDMQPWWVAIEEDENGDFAPLRLALSGWAVATSGNSRRFHDFGTLRLGHTIDPASGVPMLRGAESVTVVAESAMRADALATALMVMGEDAAQFAREHDLIARMVTKRATGLAEHLSPRFAAML